MQIHFGYSSGMGDGKRRTTRTEQRVTTPLGAAALLCAAAMIVGCRDGADESKQARRGTRPSTEPNAVWRQSTTSQAEQTAHPETDTDSPPTCPTTQTQVERVTPLTTAKPGQWVRYRMAGGYEQRLTVVETRQDEVVLKLEMWIEGKPTGLPAERIEPVDLDWALRAAERDDAEVVASKTTLRVADRDWPVRLTIARWRFEGVMYERRTWTSPDAPIYGVVRMILTADDKLAASMELVGLGPSPTTDPGRPSKPKPS